MQEDKLGVNDNTSPIGREVECLLEWMSIFRQQRVFVKSTNIKHEESGSLILKTMETESVSRLEQLFRGRPRQFLFGRRDHSSKKAFAFEHDGRARRRPT